MKVVDVMTTEVVTVDPEASVHDVARLLLDNAVSAVPVMDARGHVLGMVGEGDLLRRHETGTERRRPWWLRALVNDITLAEEYAKSHGAKARDVMSCPAIAISPAATLAEAATLMETHRVKRLPVMEGGKLVGILSRADLLRAFAATGPAADAAGTDRAIRTALLDRLRDEPWTSMDERNVEVAEGIVRFRGTVGSEEERRALRVAAESIPGVRRVEDHTGVARLRPWES